MLARKLYWNLLQTMGIADPANQNPNHGPNTPRRVLLVHAWTICWVYADKNKPSPMSVPDSRARRYPEK